MPLDGKITNLDGVPELKPSQGGGVPKLLEGAKLAFVLALRAMFASSLTNENLRYSVDKSKTKIKIYTAQPRRLEFFPCLVVSVASGDCSFKYLQDDFTYATPNDNKVYYAGQLTFDITITVMSENTTDRERMIDHLIFYLRHVFVGGIRAFGLVHGREMRIGSENMIEVENKPVYEQTINIPCFMEYKSTIDQSLMQTLRAVDTTITFTTGEVTPE